MKKSTRWLVIGQTFVNGSARPTQTWVASEHIFEYMADLRMNRDHLYNPFYSPSGKAIWRWKVISRKEYEAWCNSNGTE